MIRSRGDNRKTSGLNHKLGNIQVESLGTRHMNTKPSQLLPPPSGPATGSFNRLHPNSNSLAIELGFDSPDRLKKFSRHDRN
jgi:hypothetical protein